MEDFEWLKQGKVVNDLEPRALDSFGQGSFVFWNQELVLVVVVCINWISLNNFD